MRLELREPRYIGASRSSISGKRMRAHFRLFTILQVLAIVATIALLTFTLMRYAHVAVPLLLGSVVLLQVLVLIRFVEAHVRTLEDFFAAMAHADFTRHAAVVSKRQTAARCSWMKLAICRWRDRPSCCAC